MRKATGLNGAVDGVYVTSNGKTTWSRYGTGLPYSQVYQIELNTSLRILGAAGAAYPAITLTVNVADKTRGAVTNAAAVSGGGDTNTTNNTAADKTSIKRR